MLVRELIAYNIFSTVSFEGDHAYSLISSYESEAKTYAKDKVKSQFVIEEQYITNFELIEGNEG